MCSSATHFDMASKSARSSVLFFYKKPYKIQAKLFSLFVQLLVFSSSCNRFNKLFLDEYMLLTLCRP